VVSRYSAYGLLFESDIELPEFTASQDSRPTPDVRVLLAPVPERLENPAGTGVLFEATEGEFLLRLPDVAAYLVRGGNEILVQPQPDAIDSEVRVFMLGSAIGALLHQREKLVLHAAALGTEQGAVLFAGVSGAGKSTLLSEFLSRGYSMMVDDVCSIELDSAGDPLVMPGYPRTRLWADAAARLDVDTTDLTRTRQSLEKYERQLPDRFWNDPLPIRKIYILKSHNHDEIKITEPPLVRRFNVIKNNTYRRTFLNGLAMQESHFAITARVATTAPVGVVSRPNVGFQLKRLADAIESDLGMSPR